MKTKDLVVAFGALGAPIHLDENASRFNGASHYPAILKALLRNPNIKHVVIMGAMGSSTEKEELWKSIDPEGKIIYPLPMVHKIAQAVWGKDAKFPSFRAPYPDGSREMLPYKLTRNFQDLYARYCLEKVPKIDFGLFFITQGAAGTNIAGVVRKKTNPEEFRVQLPSVAEKCGPFLHAINILNFPWFMLSSDYRLVASMPRHDCINLPKAVMDQWHATTEWETCDSYSNGVNLTKKILTSDYGAIERLNLVDSTYVDPANDRPIKFSVVANQSVHRNSMDCQRFQQLKTWILDDSRGRDFDIYGEWSPAYITGMKDGSSKEEHNKLIEYNKKYLNYADIPKEDIIYPQFKGRVDASVVDEVFQNTRYTVCFPVISGYLTWKYLESLMNGTLPFIPPFYDEQFNAIPEDCLLRVSDPNEMYQKIEWFEQHPDKRIEVVRYYQKLWLQPCLDGSYMYPHINRFLEKYNIDCRL
jgi:hypothetical protein